MDHSVAELFVILALNPDKGRVRIDSIHFRYSLTGAILMDYLEGDEFKVENKRVVPSLRINDDAIHLLFTERIMRSSRNRKISFWVRTLTRKSRFVFSEMTKNLERKKIIRIEQKKFLNIFPYKRYWFTNNTVREKIIEDLRGILIHGRQPDKREIMLLGIVEASRAYRLLSRERGEAGLLRKKNTELLKGNIMSSEISQAIKEVQAAIIASVAAASAAAHSGH
jgi:golgi phosphoprotein 3